MNEPDQNVQATTKQQLSEMLVFRVPRSLSDTLVCLAQQRRITLSALVRELLVAALPATAPDQC